MSSCPQCQGIEDLFNDEMVSSELAHYRAKGPGKTTRMLVNALKAEGVRGLTLLDIGGGVGAVQHGLIEAGVERATDVDASTAYLHAAEKEAQRRGIADRVRFEHGDFVEIGPQVPPADIVTLDRVICCYPDMDHLVELSAERAQKFYSLVYPRDAWWMKLGSKVMNFLFRFRKNPFHFYVRPSQSIEAILQKFGFQRAFHGRTLAWEVAVYCR